MPRLPIRRGKSTAGCGSQLDTKEAGFGARLEKLRFGLGGINEKRKRTPPLLAYQAEAAFRRAVVEAIAEHRRNGVPITIWRNGKVVRIPADQIEVREPLVEYTVSHKKRE